MRKINFFCCVAFFLLTFLEALWYKGLNPEKTQQEGKMLKGDVISIYRDPLTKKDLEGEAQLRKLVLNNPDQEYWEVKFLADGHIGNRWIAKD